MARVMRRRVLRLVRVRVVLRLRLLLVVLRATMRPRRAIMARTPRETWPLEGPWLADTCEIPLKKLGRLRRMCVATRPPAVGRNPACRPRLVGTPRAPSSARVVTERPDHAAEPVWRPVQHIRELAFRVRWAAT